MQFLKIILSFTFLFLGEMAFANVSLPAIFTDNMVLQRETEVRFWGWAKPLETVTIQVGWASETYKTAADNQANWEISIKTPPAGGPYEINIQGYNAITLHNVLIGEVWLCSGQSNMEWSARMGINNAEEEVRNANFPNIRFFTVHHRTATAPQIDLESDGWKICTPETMLDFSAVAYFFAKRIQEETGMPVGLINSSWGGTPAEGWVSAKAIESDPLLTEAVKLLRNEPWAPPQPGIIYHAMVAPLAKFNIAGTIWYQGETNTANPYTYKELFSKLIESWRIAWGYDFPFYFAQIAPWRGYSSDSGVRIRDAQRRTLEVPNTGMVVTSDIGDTTDIHPRNKLDVGLRFANLALKNHFKMIDAEVSGPLLRNLKLEKDKVRVFFDHSKGLHCIGGVCVGFEMAGPDGVFHPAIASIENGTILVFAENVSKPTAVRFAWRNTATPNLFNGAGLPASCFVAALE